MAHVDRRRLARHRRSGGRGAQQIDEPLQPGGGLGGATPGRLARGRLAHAADQVVDAAEYDEAPRVGSGEAAAPRQVQPQQQVLDAVAADRVHRSAARQRRRKVLLQPLEVAVAQQQRVESAARAQQQPEAVDVPVPRQRRLGAALPVPWRELRRWASLCRLPPEKERLQPAALVPPSAAAARCRQRRQRRQGLVRSAGEL
mmetsp:Transcript_5917/g.19552  ORF Transcript_5917/g.19552 Transcript_5917/m.19552 type:complete len:201 (+) Transcript_5917:376-978(+)